MFPVAYYFSNTEKEKRGGFPYPGIGGKKSLGRKRRGYLRAKQDRETKKSALICSIAMASFDAKKKKRRGRKRGLTKELTERAPAMRDSGEREKKGGVFLSCEVRHTEKSGKKTKETPKD